MPASQLPASDCVPLLTKKEGTSEDSGVHRAAPSASTEDVGAGGPGGGCTDSQLGAASPGDIGKGSGQVEAGVCSMLQGGTITSQDRLSPPLAMMALLGSVPGRPLPSGGVSGGSGLSLGTGWCPLRI